MINMIETDKLKEHHKNGYYFTDIEGEKYEEVKRSIQENKDKATLNMEVLGKFDKNA